MTLSFRLAAGGLFSVLPCCASGQAPPALDPPLQAAVEVRVPAPTPAASSASPPEASPAPVLAGKAVYGFFGRRGIVGTLASADGHWQGAFRFLDDQKATKLQGRAFSPKDETLPEEQPLDGRKVHQFLDCEFTTTGGLPGAISDATCLDEEGVLEIDGQWSGQSGREPFYLRSLRSNTLDPGDYYAALMATPAPSHGCPPFVELLQTDSHATGRTTLLYRLTWPCDRQPEDAGDSMGAVDQSSEPAALSYEAYVGDVATGSPGPLLWSALFSSLPDPDEPNEVELHFASLELASGLDLYIATLDDEFQSPTTSGGNWTDEADLWTVSAAHQYGPKFSLTLREGGHEGWCFASSVDSEVRLIDLDANPIPELTVTDTASGRSDAMIHGQAACVDVPVKRHLSAYRLNPKTLAWERMHTVPKISKARLAKARSLQP